VTFVLYQLLVPDCEEIQIVFIGAAVFQCTPFRADFSRKDTPTSFPASSRAYVGARSARSFFASARRKANSNPRTAQAELCRALWRHHRLFYTYIGIAMRWTASRNKDVRI
jgi:hypothetical protein